MASSSSEAMVNEMGDLDGDSLRMHREGRPGKIEIIATKPLVTQRDLALAYSPGVAAPCLEIAKNPDTAYDYTAKGNLVAVISNGTAVLGLGDLGALGGKPVMEGKAVLFKRFADVDCIDLEVDTKDVDQFVNCVRYLGPTFGGINLEDIKAPECFIIEQRLRELMDIPIFHDDQHGTAIVSAAGLINALHLTGRNIKDIKMVVNGAGAASIACIELVKAMGLPHDNAILCDTKGVIYQGRTEGMNQWKSAHAVKTKARTLEEAAMMSGTEMQTADNGAPNVAGLQLDARHLATLMRQDRSLRVGFLSAGGWDTHANQGSVNGQLANNLGNLAQALVALRAAFNEPGDVIAVVSEFGRTAAENGSRGTDHGHGNAMLLIGSRINGGRRHGGWEGLAPGQLNEKRDLPVLNDFRAVLSTVLRGTQGVGDAQLAALFPGNPFAGAALMTGDNRLLKDLVRA